MQFLRTLFIGILQWQAAIVIKKYKPRILVVTGSVGKTTTKDAIYNVLAPHMHVRKSDRNFNNDIGVPLTILGVPTGWRSPLRWMKNIAHAFWLMVWPCKYPEWLVLELGIRKPGDMDRLRRWVTPDIVVVSAFGTLPSHIEFFDDKYGVWDEEARIIEGLKDDGVLILNHDDEQVMKLRDTYSVRTYTFGTDEEATIKADDPRLLYHHDDTRKGLVGIHFHINIDGQTLPVRINGTAGRSSIYTATAALTVAHYLSIPMLDAINSLENGEISKGRMRVLRGIKDTVIIDDTYNASPSAVTNALETMHRVETTGRKIIALGDMLDLGKHAHEAHQIVGGQVSEIADYLVTVGTRARAIAEEAIKSGMDERQVITFDDSQEAGKHIELLLAPHDVVLVKGSQGIRMERTVKEIMAYPEKAEELLVRQEPEWVGKKV